MTIPWRLKSVDHDRFGTNGVTHSFFPLVLDPHKAGLSHPVEPGQEVSFASLRLDIVLVQERFVNLLHLRGLLNQIPHASSQVVQTVIDTGVEIEDHRLPLEVAGDLIFDDGDDGVFGYFNHSRREFPFASSVASQFEQALSRVHLLVLARQLLPGPIPPVGHFPLRWGQILGFHRELVLDIGTTLCPAEVPGKGGGLTQCRRPLWPRQIADGSFRTGWLQPARIGRKWLAKPPCGRPDRARRQSHPQSDREYEAVASAPFHLPSNREKELYIHAVSAAPRWLAKEHAYSQFKSGECQEKSILARVVSLRQPGSRVSNDVGLRTDSAQGIDVLAGFRLRRVSPI